MSALTDMMEFTFKSRYAGYNGGSKRRETWNEAVDRFIDMFLVQYKDYPEVFKYIERVRKSMKQKNILGSQRGLQYGGDAILRKNSRIYNCCASYVDRPEFFQHCMYLLLSGCGVGYSVQFEHVNKLPVLIKRSGKKTFTIPDSIEGWSDAIGICIRSYFPPEDQFQEYSGKIAKFDYSQISPEGMQLSSCRGKTPGPEPLKRAIERIELILNNVTDRQLKPIEAHDIICHFADAVISGGVRRSALLSLFSPNDHEMMAAKTGNWFNENPQRGRSNNSVALLRNKTTFEQFKNIIQYTKQFGEPGFYFVDDIDCICNPCNEIGMRCYDATGKTGFQGCNLSTINVPKIKNKKDYFRFARDAAIIGTLQSGFTDFNYLGQTTEEIFRRENLIGVSLTGLLDNPDICLDPLNQRNAAEIIKRTNKKIAKIINVNQSARTTCCKPEGSASSMLGCSSGVHPAHASRYIRRIQTNKRDPLYQYFKSVNGHACEESVWSANDSDDVIRFPIEVPSGAKLKGQISALEFLSIVKSVQNNWVQGGKNLDLCIKPYLTHNVSNTVSVCDDEWDDVTRYIYDNRDSFSGVSLISSTGDRDFCQAPFSTVLLPREQISEYGDAALFASGLIEKALELWDSNLWKACEALLGINNDNKGASKKEWISRCKKYADRYSNGNIKTLTYCLKDVYNYKLYIDLKREFKKVDYNEFLEDEDNTNPQQEVACGGGACEIR